MTAMEEVVKYGDTQAPTERIALEGWFELAKKHAEELDRLRATASATRSKLSELVPTNWLDPLLTGPGAICDFSKRIEPQHVEALLRCVKRRIEAAEEA